MKLHWCNTRITDANVGDSLVTETQEKQFKTSKICFVYIRFPSFVFSETILNILIKIVMRLHFNSMHVSDANFNDLDMKIIWVNILNFFNICLIVNVMSTISETLLDILMQLVKLHANNINAARQFQMIVTPWLCRILIVSIQETIVLLSWLLKVRLQVLFSQNLSQIP